MFLTLLKLIGLKHQGLLIISPDKFVLLDINSERQETLVRISRHPRSLIGNFLKVETEVRSLVKSIFSSAWAYTEIVVCLEGLNEGGYTEIEIRAARELLYSAGATKVYIAKCLIDVPQCNDVFSGNGDQYIIKDA